MNAPLRTAVSIAAEITAILDRLTPDTRRGAEILLEGLGFAEDQYDGPLTDWADAKYEALSASEREDGGWRYFADEPYGHRLPRTRALGRLLVACITVALLAGCGSRTQINPGADLAVYVGSAQWMHALKPGHKGAPTYLGGYYDPEDGSITVNEQSHGWALARIFVHEIGHAYDHQKPVDLWELMARYESPNFSFNFHDAESIERGRGYMDTIADPLDVRRAIDAAREAAAAEARP